MARNSSMGQSARYRAATQAELYYLSLQHEDKAAWEDKSVPLLARKPRIIVPLFRMAVEKVDRFLWSGHRFPSAVVCPTRDADAAQNDPGEVGPAITPEQSEVLTSFVAD